MFITFPEDMPRATAFDIEIGEDIPTYGSGATNWGRINECAISTIALWQSPMWHPVVGMLDSGRLPRVLLTEDWLHRFLGQGEALVGWNSDHFDVPVIKKQAKHLYKAVAAQRHVDLMATMVCMKFGVKPSKLAAGTPANWTKLVPRIGKDATAFVNAGFGLDACAKATLGESATKMDGFTGAKVVKAWQQGRYSEVASYNIGDVGLTLGLYVHAWVEGYIISPAQGRVEIPREVL